MRRAYFILLLILLVIAAPASAQTQIPVTIAADLNPNSAAGIRIEGLVADGQGRLYTIDLESRTLYRIVAATGAVEVLATLPRPASGMAFDRAGSLYLASGELILRIAAGPLNAVPIDPSSVQTFALGTPGANGLAFDGTGNLYVSGGNTGNVYRVAPDGTVSTPISGLRSDREEQQISTNGIQFGADGRLYSANTGSGAIDRIQINTDGSVGPVERIAQNQLLRGADGIVFATNGDLYAAVNERNAIVRITPTGEVIDVTSNTNAGPLEFPASLAFVGNDLYASNFDVARGANAPADPGIGASIARIAVGVAGVPLPIAATPVAPSVPTPDPGPPGPVVSATADLPNTAVITQTTAPVTTTATTIPITGTASTIPVTGTANTFPITGTATAANANGNIRFTARSYGYGFSALSGSSTGYWASHSDSAMAFVFIASSALIVGLGIRRTRRNR